MSLHPGEILRAGWAAMVCAIVGHRVYAHTDRVGRYKSGIAPGRWA